MQSSLILSRFRHSQTRQQWGGKIDQDIYLLQNNNYIIKYILACRHSNVFLNYWPNK